MIQRSIALLFTILTLPPAGAFGQALPAKLSCLKDGSLCHGDLVFFENPDNENRVEQLLVFLPQGKTLLESVRGIQPKRSERTIPFDRLARIRPGFCAKGADGKKICPGDRVRLGDGQGMGIVQGVFTDGGLATAVKGPALVKIPATAAVKALPETATESERAGLAAVYGIDYASEDPATRVSAKDSPQRKYFADLLKRGMRAPLADFLRLWYPDRGPAPDGSTFFACERAPGKGFIPEKAAKDPACQPDTVYSWGPHLKLAATARRFPDGAIWQGSPAVNNQRRLTMIFTALSPVSTFGFGPTLLRLKLRKGTAGRPYAVAARTHDGYHDFEVLKGESIEAYAFGAPEIYDEIVRDVLRYASGKRVSIYAEQLPGQEEHPQGLARLFRQPMDNNRHDETKLKENLLELIGQILWEEGRIVYAADAERDRRRFFSTSQPSYFNPFLENGITGSRP